MGFLWFCSNMDDKDSRVAMDKDKELRQKKIETAVKFLQNHRVHQTPMAQRKAFLEKKGLTKEEIEQAVLQSGTAADENPPSTAVTPVGDRPDPSQPIVQLPSPPAVPWKGYFGAAVIGGGLGYLLVNLIKTYILPLIFDLKEQDEKLDKLESHVVELRENVTETVGSVQTTLDSVQKLLIEQQQKIQRLSSDLTSTQDKLAGLPIDSYSVGDLRSEIVSLKGLLLNRKQFPSPVIGSTPAQGVGIPAWQRANLQTGSGLFAKDRIPGDDGTIETGSSHNEQPNASKERCSAVDDHSLMNGHSSDLEKSKEESSTPSPESFSSGSETCTDTPNTVKSNISEKDMNDAVLLEDADISNDTTVSSLSDMSANASFNEASIAFSSTCIKVSSDAAASAEELPEQDNQEVD